MKASGGTDFDKYVLSRVLNKSVNKDIKDASKNDWPKMLAAWEQFAQSSPATAAKLRSLADTTTGDVTGLYDKYLSLNPFAQREQVLNYDLARAGQLPANLWGGMSRAAKGNIGALGGSGYGSPGSSAADTIMSREVAANMMPIYASIFGNAGTTTANLANVERAGLGDALAALQYRMGLPLQGYGMELDPAKALLGLRTGRANMWTDFANASKANTAGFSAGPDGMSRAGEAVSSVGSGLLGGMAGGGLGGAAGGAAGASAGGASSGGMGGFLQMLPQLLQMFGGQKQQTGTGGLTVTPGGMPGGSLDYMM